LRLAKDLNMMVGEIMTKRDNLTVYVNDSYDIPGV